MSFDNLPIETQCEILNSDRGINIVELLKLRTICHTWKDVIEYNLKIEMPTRMMRVLFLDRDEFFKESNTQEFLCDARLTFEDLKFLMFQDKVPNWQPKLGDLNEYDAFEMNICSRVPLTFLTSWTQIGLVLRNQDGKFLFQRKTFEPRGQSIARLTSQKMVDEISGILTKLRDRSVIVTNDGKNYMFIRSSFRKQAKIVPTVYRNVRI